MVVLFLAHIEIGMFSCSSFSAVVFLLEIGGRY